MDKSFTEILKSKEEEYLKSTYNWKVLNEKKEKLKNLKCRLENLSNLREEDFEEIRQCALEEGGFLNFEYRLFFYDKILKNNQCEDNLGKIYTNYFDKVEHDNLEYTTPSENENEFELDASRSILFKIFSADVGNETLLTLKNDLQKFSNVFFSLNSKNFDYYQGFQELAFYFYLLGMMSCSESKLIAPHPDIQSLILLQKTSDYYFSHCICKLRKVNFESILLILSELIGNIDKNVKNYLQEITNTKPYYALTWVITWFAHKNTNLFSQYRVIDYLLCSPPFTILYMSAIIIIDEFSEFLKQNQLSIEKEEIEVQIYF